MEYVSVRGVIHRISEENRKVSDRWTVREFVLKLDPEAKYPQIRLYQAVKGVMAELDKFNVGDEVEVEVFFRGREFPSTKSSKEMSYYSIDEVHKITKLLK